MASGSLPRAWPRPPALAGSASLRRLPGGCGMPAERPGSRPHLAREPRWSCVSGEAEQSPRLLVVDDHPIWRDGVSRDLQEAGLTVVGTAGDGAQALRVAAATRPQVVLLDLHLPDLAGGELIRQLLALDASIRILVLSASGERQDVLDAMTAGATGYLVKSARLTELLAAVRSVAAGDSVFTAGLAGLVLGEYRRLAAGESAAGGTAGAASGAGARRPAAHHPGDRDPEADRDRPDLPADRRAPRHLAQDRPEPRAEHARQAAAAQQGATGALCAGARHRVAAAAPSGRAA